MSLMKSHLSFAKFFWEEVLSSQDSVIDATLGNGHDTLYLAKLLKENKIKKIYGFDIQDAAITCTRKRLEEKYPSSVLDRITLLKKSHEHIDQFVEDESIKLIVYNLGYLPGSDKTVTTVAESTITSLEKAFDIIIPNGVISVTCYPGHVEGKQEEIAVKQCLDQLAPEKWCILNHRCINRVNAPSLYIIQRIG